MPALYNVLKSPCVYNHIKRFVEHSGALSFYEFSELQTIETSILITISSWNSIKDVAHAIKAKLMNDACFVSSVFKEFHAKPLAKQRINEIIEDVKKNNIVEFLNKISKMLNTRDEEAEVIKTLLGHYFLSDTIWRLLKVIAPE